MFNSRMSPILVKEITYDYGLIKAAVNRKYPRIPVFHQFRQTVTHLKTKNKYAVQRQYQLGASIRPLKPLHAACVDRLEREVHQLDRTAPLKVRACRGT